MWFQTNRRGRQVDSLGSRRVRKKKNRMIPFMEFIRVFGTALAENILCRASGGNFIWEPLWWLADLFVLEPSRIRPPVPPSKF